METVIVYALLILALMGFVGWLGGGRKWAFRTLLSALILAAIASTGTLLYMYGTDELAERRAKKIHECGLAKVADPKCYEAPKNSDFPKGALICPLYTISDNASPEQEQEALAAAEQECRGEVDPKEKPLHERIAQYKREHGIVEKATAKDNETGPWTKYQKKGDIFDQVAAEDAVGKKRLSARACASKVRTAYPGAYNDLDDATLTKKVLAKYPTYCDLTSSSPDFIPDVKNIR